MIVKNSCKNSRVKYTQFLHNFSQKLFCAIFPKSGQKIEIINNKFALIKLPEYVSILAYNFTIQITSIYDEDLIDDSSERNYKAGKVIDNSFKVYGNKNGAFYWTVYGERAKIDVEPLKNNTIVKGAGPYTWI